MTTDLFVNVSDEERHEIAVEAAQHVDLVLDLRPFEGHLDDGYEYDHTDDER